MSVNNILHTHGQIYGVEQVERGTTKTGHHRDVQAEENVGDGESYRGASEPMVCLAAYPKAVIILSQEVMPRNTRLLRQERRQTKQ